MITPEELADLRAGDVVRVEQARYEDTFIQGPLREDAHGCLMVGYEWLIRAGDGAAFAPADVSERITIISRVPRLYVNCPRTEPAAGDVVRNADDRGDTRVWMFADDDYFPWRLGAVPDAGDVWLAREELPARLDLLVDGTTGLRLP